MKTILYLIVLSIGILPKVYSQNNTLDARVDAFLKKSKGKWHDLNVPFEDGKILHDIIVKNGYKSALEIGTSTGHSTVWIAWAMSKTGGKVTTIEIDPKRHKEALKNIEEAGLSQFVDARLANAHDLVKSLPQSQNFLGVGHHFQSEHEEAQAKQDWQEAQEDHARYHPCNPAHAALHLLNRFRRDVKRTANQSLMGRNNQSKPSP